ncbi:MAG: NUDIX hydrolase [Clostridia bacterium]|nr:NUDIX hydrolase [Clostridia bacterium]
MKFKSLEKVHEGKFVDRYDLTYELKDGSEKVYEMISRDHGICEAEDPFARLQREEADSVVLFITDPTGEKLLISKELRLACGDWVYNVPAGLIDPGETPEESAKRELWEETGLTLESIDDKLDHSFAAVGFSNEKNICIFGTASGEFKESTSAEEEIIPGWYTKEEVRVLLRKEYFAARTQAYCYLWSKES